MKFALFLLCSPEYTNYSFFRLQLKIRYPEMCLSVFFFFFSVLFFSELCWGKAVVAYTKPQQRKKEGGRLRGERDQIKFLDLGFERWQVVRFRKVRRGQDVPYIACSWDE